MAEEKSKIVHTVELDGPRPNIHVAESEFKGRPTINLIFLDGYARPQSMGVGKVKQILHCLPELKAFYEKHKHRLDKSDE